MPVKCITRSDVSQDLLPYVTVAFQHRACHMYQVTTDAFASIVEAETCEPSNIYVAATVGQGGNMINAFDNMGIPVLICSGHRLNSAVSRATGITESFNRDGSRT